MEKLKNVLVKNISTEKYAIQQLPRNLAVNLINNVNTDMEHPELRANFTTKGKGYIFLKKQQPKFTAFSNGGSYGSGILNKYLKRRQKPTGAHKIQFIPVYEEGNAKGRDFKRNPHYNGNNPTFAHLFHIVGWNKVVHYPNLKGHISA